MQARTGIILLVAVLSLLGLFALLAERSPGPSPTGATQADADALPTLERIADSLERIEAHLSAIQRNPPALVSGSMVAGAGVEGSAAGSEAVGTEIAGTLETIREEINDLALAQQADRSHLSSELLGTARRNARVMDLTAIARIRASHERDKSIAEQELLLLNPAQVLSKLGMPNDVNIGQTGAPFWYYRVADGRVQLGFSDGYVASVNIK